MSDQEATILKCLMEAQEVRLSPEQAKEDCGCMTPSVEGALLHDQFIN